MPDIREEFEAWARPEGVALWPHPNGSDRYYCGSAQKAWEAWQASRAALKVELPPTITVEEAAEHFNIDEDGIDMAVGIAHMVNGAIWSCAAFIKQAGIEVVK